MYPSSLRTASSRCTGIVIRETLLKDSFFFPPRGGSSLGLAVLLSRRPRGCLLLRGRAIIHFCEGRARFEKLSVNCRTGLARARTAEFSVTCACRCDDEGRTTTPLAIMPGFRVSFALKAAPSLLSRFIASARHLSKNPSLHPRIYPLRAGVDSLNNTLRRGVF